MPKQVEQTKGRVAVRVAGLWVLAAGLLGLGAVVPAHEYGGPGLGGLGGGGRDVVLLRAPGESAGDGFELALPTGWGDGGAGGAVARGPDGQLLFAYVDGSGGSVRDTLARHYGSPLRTAGGVEIAGRAGVLHVYDVDTDGGGENALFVAAAKLRDGRVVILELATFGPARPEDQRTLEAIARDARVE